MKPTPRKKDYVDPQVQGELARRLVLHWLLFTIVAAFIAISLEWLEDPLRTLPQLVWEASWNYGPFLLVLIALVPIFIYDSIKLSNRFAGPVYRLRKVAAALADGELPGRVELRGTDFWRDLAKDFNHIIARIARAEGIEDTVGPNAETWTDTTIPLATDADSDDDVAMVAGRIEGK